MFNSNYTYLGLFCQGYKWLFMRFGVCAKPLFLYQKTAKEKKNGKENLH